MSLPKLPAAAFSLIGAVPVCAMDPARADKEDLYGRFLPAERRIEISAGMAREIEWATYWHEVAHVILVDAGAVHSLSEVQQEIVCDAVGTYLTAMMRAGQLAHRTPRADGTGTTRSHP